MKWYKAVIAYDGTDYYGWQLQKNKISVAQVLQERFYEVFGSDIKLFAVSRTDAGVHALGQVVAFKSDLAIDVKNMKWAWSNHLPETITIRSLDVVEDRFNPHVGVAQKTYIYHFFTQTPLPFIARYGYHVRKTVNLDRLKEALQIFVGTHDFRSFSTGDERGEDTVRTIDTISVRYMQRYNAYAIIIKGPKFLRHMVRRIVGAALAAATTQHVSVEYLKEVLHTKNPCHILPNAPAKGLVLYKITYIK